MAHNKYPRGGKTDLMENTTLGRAKSNHAYPEKTAQLVGDSGTMSFANVSSVIHEKAQLTGCGSVPPNKWPVTQPIQLTWSPTLSVSGSQQGPTLNSAKGVL